MSTYVYEVAPWCKTNWHAPEVIEVPFDRSNMEALADEIALAEAVDTCLPIDRDTWAQLPDELARAAWDSDGLTVAAFNVTGPRGTYQTRLAREATS